MGVLGRIAAAATLLLVAAGASTASAQSPAWTGFYAGVNVGGGFATADHTSQSGLNDLSPSGVVGGVQLGYDWALASKFTLGVLVEADLAGLSASCSSPNCPQSAAPSTAEKISSIGSVSLRFGLPNGSILPYVLIGVASAATTRDTAYQSQSNNKSFSGVTFGGGVEWAKSANWSWNAQFNYYDLGSQTYDFDAGYQPTVHLTAATFKIGINKHF